MYRLIFSVAIHVNTVITYGGRWPGIFYNPVTFVPG